MVSVLAKARHISVFTTASGLFTKKASLKALTMGTFVEHSTAGAIKSSLAERLSLPPKSA